jgi:hypothetical protein
MSFLRHHFVASETLKIGDYVTLRQLKLDGLLGAEGILEEDLGITFIENGILDDALFAIHLKRQYSAFREYEDFINSKNSGQSDKYLGALKVRARPCEHRYYDFMAVDSYL